MSRCPSQFLQEILPYPYRLRHRTTVPTFDHQPHENNVTKSSQMQSHRVTNHTTEREEKFLRAGGAKERETNMIGYPSAATASQNRYQENKWIRKGAGIGGLEYEKQAEDAEELFGLRGRGASSYLIRQLLCNHEKKRSQTLPRIRRTMPD